MATKRHHYTPKELDDAAIADLINDVECAERQSVEGPFYPERGITAESLAAYAIKCRGQADSFYMASKNKELRK